MKNLKAFNKKVRLCLYLIGLLCIIADGAKAQQANWQNLDLQKDGVFGISTERVYTEVLKGKKPKPVVVAILDSGTDTTHVDLKSSFWINPKEKPGNGKDDDKNGYIDDVHGWSFIGGKNGNVQYDNLELTRLIRRGDGKADTAMQNNFDRQRSQAVNTVNGMTNFKRILDTIVNSIGKPEPAVSDIQNYNAIGRGQTYVKNVLLKVLPQTSYKIFREKELDEPLAHFKAQEDYQLNPDFDSRVIVGDNYANSTEKLYGTKDVTGPLESALHGTHVAGIVGADRKDTVGVKGVADNVKLMIVRAVPDGDERDKDIANGIRYAVDNGAKVINMSFGKPYSWDKAAVDAAVKYAISKDVLLVQAAGNSAENIDSAANFPNRRDVDGNTIDGSWIVVGASGWKNDSTLAAPFSNYGKTAVDVFAPGEQILSTIPGNAYAREDGTSMASPVVAGLAALIREYYPKLTAMQVKDIILRSAVKVDHPVSITKNGHIVSVDFTELCRTGGIVNAYTAIDLAEKITNK